MKTLIEFYDIEKTNTGYIASYGSFTESAEATIEHEVSNKALRDYVIESSQHIDMLDFYISENWYDLVKEYIIAMTEIADRRVA